MSSHYVKDLSGAWQTIIMFALLGLVLALIISFVQPLRYSSTARLLILQSSSDPIDAYTASRSEERIAENLAALIYTSSFYEQVINSGFTIDQSIFPEQDYKRRKAWNKTVDAVVARGSGFLTIRAYHHQVDQAEQIVRAIAHILTQNVNQFTSGSNVSVRLVDAPLNSRFPVKPNILANIASGFFLGGFVGMGYIMVQSERIRRRHQFIHEEV